jgi:hypothetical protein
VALDWADSGEPDLVGYSVYRGTASGGPYGTKLNSAPLTSSDFVDTTVTNGTTYYYVVRAENALGESPNSGQASATPQGTVAPEPPTATVIEGESMSLPSGAALISNSSASGGRFVRLWWSGTMSASRSLPAVARITVRAYGDQCNGAPEMQVRVDGANVISTGVTATSFTDYSADVALPAGAHSIAVAFTNDYYAGAGCDRNLNVDKVTLTPAGI